MVNVGSKVVAGGENQFANVLTYVYLCLTISTVVIQTHFLATALKYFDGAPPLPPVAVGVCLCCCI
jgi:hypothetical protein